MTTRKAIIGEIDQILEFNGFAVSGKDKATLNAVYENVSKSNVRLLPLSGRRGYA
jgi:hypothetical protein